MNGPKDELIDMLQSRQKGLFQALAQAAQDMKFKNHAAIMAGGVDELIALVEDMNLSEVKKLVAIAKQSS